jgi:hypothetical protein
VSHISPTIGLTLAPRLYKSQVAGRFEGHEGQFPRASLDAYHFYCTPRPLLPEFDSGHIGEGV